MVEDPEGACTKYDNYGHVIAPGAIEDLFTVQDDELGTPYNLNEGELIELYKGYEDEEEV